MGKRSATESTSSAKRAKTGQDARASGKSGARAEEPARSGNDKRKTAVPSPASDDEDDEDEEEDEDEELVDSEEDEFAQTRDDGEDLMANLDHASDDDDDDGDSSDGTDPEADSIPSAPAPPALKKANIRNSRQKAPLKPAELRALAFAELTASPISGFISTNVNALLGPTLSPPAPATSPLQPLLKLLHAHLVQLPSRKPISLVQMRNKGVVVPTVEGIEGKWGNVECAFEKPRPEDVRVVGRWAWGGGIKIKGEYFVDIAIAMPEALLQPKDYLSPRFLIKSTHYLTTLASSLPPSLGPVTLSYTLLPTSSYALEIRSSPSSSSSSTEKTGLSKTKGAVLRLRILAPPSLFPHSKLSPLSNLSRPTTSPDDAVLPATPLRASSLLASHLSTHTSHLTFHHTLATTHPAYTASIRLLQTWASKRDYPASLGVTDDFWAWCVARTLNWGAPAGNMAGGVVGGDAWAGWRKTVEWLAGVEWTEGVWFRVEGSAAYEKDDFRTAFKGKPLFVDPTGTVNLAAGIDLATLEMLRQDAKTTIALLLSEADEEDKFNGSLMQQTHESERFDNFIRITVPPILLSTTAGPSDDSLDFSTPLHALISGISSTLRRALGTRINTFQLVAPLPPSIPVIGSSPPTSPLVLTLGLLLSPSESGRLVDQGPSAEDELACADFRAFWGRKSELRRFKDGAIVESLVWDDPQPGGMGQQRSLIVGQIVRYILDHRHAIKETDVEVFAGRMDHLLVEPESVRRAVFLADPVQSGRGFTAVLDAFDSLSRELKDLSDLPLAVASIQPSTPSLRYSSIFVPAPRRLKQFERFPDSTKFIEVHDMVLTLEGSGRWPEDLEGVQKIKAAFLSKIAEGLSQLHTIVQAQVVFEDSARPIDDNVALEILTASGFAFRARIFYDRSLLLLQQREKKLGGPESTDEDSPLEVYQERFVHAPRHHAALATLQHHFTSYSPTVRLLKRWLSAHMLSSYFPSELVELVAASVFLDPATPYESPNSGATGFARAMNTLANWRWRDEPLLVALYSFSNNTTAGRRPQFAKDARDKAAVAFEQRRLADPSVNEFAWVVCTEGDPQGKVWGRATGKVAAGRVRALAKATLKTLNEGLKTGTLVVDQLFSAPLSDYAFLIHLDASVVPRHFQSIAPSPFALASHSRNTGVLAGSIMGSESHGTPPRLGWDPVADFVSQVQASYPSTFLLFHSTDGAPVIGGIWNPSAEAPRAWKIGLGFPCKPVVGEDGKDDGKARVVLDKEAVMREIERLGTGLVVRTEMVQQ
ncbi:hypothetical protein RQP46_008603 [Phenoliferia psychrophenolica]